MLVLRSRERVHSFEFVRILNLKGKGAGQQDAVFWKIGMFKIKVIKSDNIMMSKYKGKGGGTGS